MPKQQHQPWDIKTFNKGAQKDTDKEFLGASPKGEYIDSQNMRPTALDGDTGSIEKIGGELLKYELLDNDCHMDTPYYPFKTNYIGADYICMAAIEINDKFVEIWADKDKIGPPIIRVDGKVVLKNVDFPIDTDHPLQTAKNENCVGGEIYITDYNVEPMLFNIEDMMKNAGLLGGECGQKYFAAFNPDDHKVNLKRPLNHPVFVEVFATSGSPQYTISTAIVITEGGSSMPVGYYQYAIRYGYTDGDRTVWSVATPLIPVVQVVKTQSDYYPSVRTISSPPDILVGSGYAIKIRFRLNNINNYNFLEIKRISYNSGDPLGTTPNPVLVKTILGIDDTDTYAKPCIIDFIDKGAESEGEIAPDEETTVIGVIDRAKAIRYYNNRLYLMNIEYSKRDVTTADVGLVPAEDGNYIIPQIRNLQKVGYNHIYNSAYYKGYERGERYSYAIVFHDDKGEKSFAVPIQDNYQFPNRRDEISADTSSLVQEHSKGSLSDALNLTVICADSVSSISRTHEVFDMKDAIYKDNLTNFNSVMSAGQREKGFIQWWAPYDDTIDPYEVKTLPIVGEVIRCNEIGYKPLRPTGTADTISQNAKVGGEYPRTAVAGAHEQVINTRVVADRSGGTDTWYSVNEGSYDSYNNYAYPAPYYRPKIFAPNYYAMGGAIKKITFPDWAVASNIVRSKPARRVIAQGIGFYHLNPAVFTTGSTLTTKTRDKFWFYSPDIDAGFIDASEIASIGASGNYTVELVSPLGTSTEVYGGKHQSGGRDRNIDMVTYLRVLFEDGSINIGDYNTTLPPAHGGIPWVGANIGKDGYVQYGKWRNPSTDGFAYSDLSNIDSSTGKTKQFPIIKFSTLVTGSGRQTFYELELGTWDGRNHYRKANTKAIGEGDLGKPQFADTSVKEWHEPFYIVNIIKEENNIDSGNVDEYFETGQYLKKESLIGVWDNNLTTPENTQTLYLVDERWEDCIPNYYAPTSIRELQQRFVYIKAGNSGVERKWINITFLDSTLYTNIVQDILNNNSATYGIDGFYTSTYPPNDNEFNGLKFGFQGTVGSIGDTTADYNLIPQAFVPENDDYIYVKYDNNIPISFFGGDSYVGESMFCPIDDFGDTKAADLSQFAFGVPLPYSHYEVNPRIYIPNKVQSKTFFTANRIQDQFDLKLDYIRQMAVMATLEQKLAIQYMYTNDSLDYNGAASSAIITNKMFPQVHYVMSPNEWEYNDEFATGDGGGGVGEVKIFGNYPNSDYMEFTDSAGGKPNDFWKNGGIRSSFAITLCENIDYSNEPNTTTEFTKPKVGFNEETLYCTRIVWSEAREPNMIDSPGVRTFPALNYFDISDDTGEIKHAYDATSDKGNNLYAFTNSGLCLLMTDKREVVDTKIAEVALMSVESQLGVQQQYWLSKTIGMNDEMWRSAAEYNNAIYFANYNSVYKFVNNTLGDIGKLGYAVKIREQLLDKIRDGYATPLSACYDIYHAEYWITNAYDDEKPKTFAYNDATKHWNGLYDYDYEKYISFKRKTYGMKGISTILGTYELNTGYTMNGSIMSANVSQACSPKQIMSKEFIRIRVASDNKPVSVNFSYTDEGANLCTLSQAIQGTRYLKDYGAYEQYIPREQSGDKYRLQGRLLIYKIIHNLEEHFEVVDVGVQYKLLK